MTFNFSDAATAAATAELAELNEAVDLMDVDDDDDDFVPAGGELLADDESVAIYQHHDPSMFDDMMDGEE